MPNEYELCRSNLETLVASESADLSHRNEATTRLQLIDRLFFDCLAWSKEAALCEQSLHLRPIFLLGDVGVGKTTLSKSQK